MPPHLRGSCAKPVPSLSVSIINVRLKAQAEWQNPGLGAPCIPQLASWVLIWGVDRRLAFSCLPLPACSGQHLGPLDPLQMCLWPVQGAHTYIS